jgi:hypothetical protein
MQFSESRLCTASVYLNGRLVSAFTPSLAVDDEITFLADYAPREPFDRIDKWINSGWSYQPDEHGDAHLGNVTSQENTHPLKTIEKGIKDVTTELLLHMISRTGDTDVGERQDQITQDDSDPTMKPPKRQYRIPPQPLLNGMKI